MNPVDHPHGGGEGSRKEIIRSRHGDSRPRASRHGTTRVRTVHREAAQQPIGSVLVARSVKKGPFIDDHLLAKVQTMNASRDRRVDQDVVAALDDHAGYGRATPLPCTTGASSFRSSCRRIWWATSSASSHRRGPFTATPVIAKPR